MLSLSPTPAQAERSVSLAHAGETTPTYGERCVCVFLCCSLRHSGPMSQQCYKKASLLWNNLCATVRPRRALVSAIACWKWGAVVGQRQLTKRILPTSFGPRGPGASAEGKRQKWGVEPSSVLPCSRRLVCLAATCATLTNCWSPHSQKDKKMHFGTFDSMQKKMLSGSALRRIKWYAWMNDTATQKKEKRCGIPFVINI